MLFACLLSHLALIYKYFSYRKHTQSSDEIMLGLQMREILFKKLNLSLGTLLLAGCHKTK